MQTSPQLLLYGLQDGLLAVNPCCWVLFWYSKVPPLPVRPLVWPRVWGCTCGGHCGAMAAHASPSWCNFASSRKRSFVPGKRVRSVGASPLRRDTSSRPLFWSWTLDELRTLQMRKAHEIRTPGKKLVVSQQLGSGPWLANRTTAAARVQLPARKDYNDYKLHLCVVSRGDELQPIDIQGRAPPARRCQCLSELAWTSWSDRNSHL